MFGGGSSHSGGGSGCDVFVQAFGFDEAWHCGGFTFGFEGLLLLSPWGFLRCLGVDFGVGPFHDRFGCVLSTVIIKLLFYLGSCSCSSLFSRCLADGTVENNRINLGGNR